MDNNQINLIMNAITNIEVKIVDALKKIKPVDDRYESEDIKELAAALSKAQGQYKPLGENRENPYFKSSYADLDGIFRATRAALSLNGLSFSQQIKNTDEGQTILHTKLMHASGQWIESRNRVIPVKNDMQTLGSTLSYLKRYAALAILGISSTNDAEDDDAEVAMVPIRDVYAKGTALNTKYNPKENVAETVSKEQIEELEYELASYTDIAEMVLSGLKIQSIADMPKNKYMQSIKRIREIKQSRENSK